jgi:hypothetical protein
VLLVYASQYVILCGQVCRVDRCVACRYSVSYYVDRCVVWIGVSCGQVCRLPLQCVILCDRCVVWIGVSCGQV